MIPEDELNRKIGQINETTSEEMDRRVIAEIRNAVAPSQGRSVLPAVKLLAAAAVLVVLVLLAIALRPRESEPQREGRPSLSVAEMLTVGHLNTTYRMGGMTALNDVCEEAAERVDTKPKELTASKLITELDDI